VRTRVIHEPQVLGSRKSWNGTGDLVEEFYYSPQSTGYHQCDDYNPGWNSPGEFFVQKKKLGTITYEWTNPVNGARTRYEDLVHPAALSHLDPIECGAPYTWAPEYLGTMAAARTNPSRPDVSIYQFLGELRDLPKEVFEKGLKGQNWAREENSAIATRFGILPFVNDILKMTRFQKSVHDRMGEFERLSSGKGLCRRVRLGRYKGGYEQDSPLPYDILRADETKFHCARVTHWDMWAQVRWKPGTDDIFQAPTDSDEYIHFIEALIHGTSVRNDGYSYGRDIWELVPWSWLSDWFVNFGDYLDANRNQNIAEVESIFVCGYAVTVQRDQGPLGHVESYLEDKMRQKVYPSLQAVNPIMSADQVATLHSLATQDRRHRLPAKWR